MLARKRASEASRSYFVPDILTDLSLMVKVLPQNEALQRQPRTQET